MKIIPAIDLKDNKCVRLSKGRDNSSIVFNEDPEKQAAYFQDIGCKKLHIVDLDAAFGRPDINIKTIQKIRSRISTPIQLGGGIRDRSQAIRYFNLGIDNLIIGSLSVKNPDEVKDLSNRYKNKIYVSLDIKDKNVMIKGWREKSKLRVIDVLKLYKNSYINGYIFTDINNDGMLNGLDTDFIENMINDILEINKLTKKIIIAGGLTNYEDLVKLKKLNTDCVEGIISGKSYYVGNIDLTKAQKIIDING